MSLAIVRPKSADAIVANPPITAHVFLMCERCRKPTTHRYVVTRAVGPATTTHEQVYGCADCKTERRYGLLG